MRLKKTIIRIITVGTIFIFAGFNFAYMVSVNDISISSFWKKNKIVSFYPKTYAEDDEDDDDYRGSRSITPASSSPSTTTAASGTTSAPTTQATTTANTPSTTTSASGTAPSTNVTTKTPAVVTPPATTTKVITPTPTAKPVLPTPVPVVTKNTIKASQTSATVKPVQQALAPSSTTPVSNQESSAAVQKWKDGIYLGTSIYRYPGYSFEYRVEITISGGKITQAQWKAFKEVKSAGFDIKRGNAELQRLVDNQDYSINTVTGATGVSNALYSAISTAMASAKSAPETKIQIPSATIKSSANVNVPVKQPIKKSTSVQPQAPVTVKSIPVPTPTPAPAPTPTPTPTPVPDTTTKAS